MHFDSFGTEYIPQEALSKINHTLRINTLRIQDDDSIMCGFYCTVLIYASRKNLEHTNLFSPYGYKNNENINISTLKINMTDDASLEFRLKK